MSVNKLQSLKGGSGVHVFWCCGRRRVRLRPTPKEHLAVGDVRQRLRRARALLHKGPFRLMRSGKSFADERLDHSRCDRLETKDWWSGARTAPTGGKDSSFNEGRQEADRTHLRRSRCDLERLASRSLTKAERETLIRLLRRWLKAAGALEQSDEESK